MHAKCLLKRRMNIHMQMTADFIKYNKSYETQYYLKDPFSLAPNQNQAELPVRH